MKIFLISDIEGKRVNIPHKAFKDVSFCFIAGDITTGSPNEKRIQKIFSNLGSVFPFSKKVFFVPGNHDHPKIARNLPFWKENFIQMHKKWILIDKNGFNKPIAIFGFRGAIKGLYNKFAFSERDYYDTFEKVIKHFGRNQSMDDFFSIFLVHDAPFDTLIDKTHQNQHVGSRSLRKLIEKHRPNLCLSGHIHESKGIDYIGQTVLINPGDWKFNHNYVILDIKEDEKQTIQIKAEFLNNKHKKKKGNIIN